jgi:signal transduction histidine kinase
MKRAANIETKLIRQIQFVVIGFWAVLLAVLSLVAYFAFAKFQEDSSLYVKNYVTSVAESYAMSRDHFAIQRELHRFATEFEKAQGVGVDLEIRLNDQLVASYAAKSPGMFTWEVAIRKILPSSDNLAVEGLLDYKNWFYTLFGMAAFGTGLMTILLLSLQYFTRLSIRKVTTPLAKKIGDINLMANDLTNLPPANQDQASVLEIDHLNQSTNTLVAAIANYRVALNEQLQKTADVEARYAKKEAVELMAQLLAHDVKRPLTIATRLLESLETRPPEDIDDIVHTFLPKIRDALFNAEGMIENTILLGSGNRASKQAASLESMIEDYALHNTGCRFNLSFENSESVSLDPISAKRLIANLLDNATQASGASHAVDIATAASGDSVDLQIKNYGTGLSASEISRIFEPFYTRGKSGGSGLGLAACKKIVVDAGGTITCHSDGYSWVSFTATLPKCKSFYSPALDQGARL